MVLLKPGKHPGQIGHKQGRIDRHIENGRHQREPGFLKSPEIPHGAAYPGVVAAFEGQRAGKLADHECRRQAPEERGQKQDEDRFAVPGAVHDVFGPVRPARNHEERGSDQGPKGETDGFFPGSDTEELGRERLVVAVAVANFYGFLLRRLTLTTASPLTFFTRLPGWTSDSRAFSAKLVRNCEITGNFHRCNIFFGNFCQKGSARR